jgi:hypothetical protein
MTDYGPNGEELIIYGRHSTALPRPRPVELNEPPVGTVVAFSVVHLGGKVYDYASVRAGNGLWYTTGGRAMQGVAWSKLIDSVRERAAGPLRIMQPGQAYYF